MSPTLSIAGCAENTQLVVDCAQLFSITHAGADQAPADALLRWVRTAPQAARIHVVLRNALMVQEGRKLQSTLQALGCRVTATCRFLQSTC